MCELISRQAAIGEAEKWIETYNSGRGGQRERDAIKHVISGIKKLPSAQPERTEYISDIKAVRSKRDCVDLAERVDATFYDQEHEEWTQKTVTIADVLDSVCDEYTILPSAQPYTDEEIQKMQDLEQAQLDKAYELGRQSAQPERLTDDDFETIRIHLNAYKEKLCNQQRWKEADEYQRIIDRFMAFASAQPDWNELMVICDNCGHAIHVKKENR